MYNSLNFNFEMTNGANTTVGYTHHVATLLLPVGERHGPAGQPVGPAELRGKRGRPRHDQRVVGHDHSRPTIPGTTTRTTAGRRRDPVDHRRDLEHRDVERAPDRHQRPGRRPGQPRAAERPQGDSRHVRDRDHPEVRRLGQRAGQRACRSPASAPTSPARRCRWAPGTSAATGTSASAPAIPNTAYSHVNAPNTPRCTYTGAEFPTDWCGGMCSAAPTSNHSGGVNVCFADGSVKFIKNTIATADLVGPRHPQPRRGGRRQRTLIGTSGRLAAVSGSRRSPRYVSAARPVFRHSIQGKSHDAIALTCLAAAFLDGSLGRPRPGCGSGRTSWRSRPRSRRT